MRFRFFFLFITLPFFQPTPLIGQDSTAVKKDTLHRLNADYFKSYWWDARDVAVAPLHWKRNQWIGFGGVVASSALLYLWDEDIQEFFQDHRSHAGDQISKYALEPWGSVYGVSLMAGFYIEGLINKNNRSKKTALLGLKTMAVTVVYSRIPKYLFQRHRPDADDPPNAYLWEGPFHGITGHTSFPSGHAATVFSLAAIVASEYRQHRAVPIIAYSIAGAASLSRIYDNRHWASDVLVGAAFGFAIGKLIYHKDNWINGRKKKPVNKAAY